MKNQKKQLLGMLLLLVLLIAAYFGVRYYNDAKEQEESAELEKSKIKITDFAVEDINYLSYDVDGTVYSYEKNGDSWSWEEDATIDLEESQIETMLQSVASLDAAEQLSEYTVVADYGLENPEKTITIGTGDETVTLYIGSKNEITGKYYLMRQDADTVYLVDKDLTGTFSKLPQDMQVQEEETETEIETEASEAVIEESTEE